MAWQSSLSFQIPGLKSLFHDLSGKSHGKLLETGAFAIGIDGRSNLAKIEQTITPRISTDNQGVAESARRCAAFVSFGVQVTRDGHAVIFHDKVVHVGGAEAPEARPVCNLSLQEFQFCSTCNCLSEIPKGLPPDDDAPARLIGTPTLREAFDVLPADVGVDVTVKVTTCPATTTCQEIDRVLTPVLEDVAEEIGRRTVACSAYDIDACIEMRRRMPELAVLLRSTADEEASDGRRISPGQAVKLASSHGLTGIVVDSGELSPQLVGEAKPHGLYVLAQGGSGGDPEWVSRQKRLGADGVIASDAGAALEVVAPLREQQQQPS